MPWVQYIGRRALAGDVLGPNLISNGHFTSATTGWTGNNASLSVTASGKLRVTTTGTGAGTSFASATITTVSGTLYAVDVDFEQGTANLGLVYVFGANASSPNCGQSSLATGTHRIYFVADSTTTTIRLYANTATMTVGHYNDWDNVKVREVQVRGHATDIEHVVGGSLTYDYSSLTKGTGWTVGSGVASSDGTQTAVSDLQFNTSSSISAVRREKTFDTSFDVTARSAGNVLIVLGGGAATANGTSRSTVATFSEQLTVPELSSSQLIRIRADADFIGSVDNVSVTLAADNTWSLDFDIADMQPGRSRMANSVQTLDGTTDTQYWSSKKTLVVQTDVLAYGEWQFLEEFADNAIDGQTITFDPFGTESQPKAPGSYILTDYSLRRIIGADTTERRQYQLQFREA